VLTEKEESLRTVCERDLESSAFLIQPSFQFAHFYRIFTQSDNVLDESEIGRRLVTCGIAFRFPRGLTFSVSPSRSHSRSSLSTTPRRA